jgi:hypothetical protein
VPPSDLPEIPQPEEELPFDLELTKDEVVPIPVPDQPLDPKQKAVYGEDFLSIKPIQQEKRKKVIED